MQAQSVTLISKRSSSTRQEGGLWLSGVKKKPLPEKPLITIITATFNAAEYFPGTVESIRNQTYKNAEWIVIDGASNDGTVDLIRQNEDVIDYWMSEPDGGIYDAWNKALLKATGTWLIFIGAGDNLSDGWLETVASSSEVPDLIYGDCLMCSADGQRRFLRRLSSWDVQRKKLLRAMTLPHTGMAHHHRLFASGARFDPAYRFAGDWEFLRRVAPTRGRYEKGKLQAVMRLGGVGNNPVSIRRAYDEIHKIHECYGTRMSIVEWCKCKIKMTAAACPQLYILLQALRWR